MDLLLVNVQRQLQLSPTGTEAAQHEGEEVLAICSKTVLKPAAGHGLLTHKLKKKQPKLLSLEMYSC